MARSENRRRTPVPRTDLGSTLEQLASQLGDRIGERLVEVLQAAGPSGEGAQRPLCAREGCDRPVAAKGFCKSHYNLMLYHRRKAEGRQQGRRKR